MRRHKIRTGVRIVLVAGTLLVSPAVQAQTGQALSDTPPEIQYKEAVIAEQSEALKARRSDVEQRAATIAQEEELALPGEDPVETVIREDEKAELARERAALADQEAELAQERAQVEQVEAAVAREKAEAVREQARRTRSPQATAETLQHAIRLDKQAEVEADEARVAGEEAQLAQEAAELEEKKAAVVKKKAELAEDAVSLPEPVAPQLEPALTTAEDRLEATQAAIAAEETRVIAQERKEAAVAQEEAIVSQETAILAEKKAAVEREKLSVVKKQAAITSEDSASEAQPAQAQQSVAERAAEQVEIAEDVAEFADINAQIAKEQAEAARRQAEEQAKYVEDKQTQQKAILDKAPGEVTWAKKAALILEEVMDSPDRGIPTTLLNQARCVVVFPSVIKAGFMVTAKYGDGITSCRQPTSGIWGPPAFFSIAGGSVGFRAGTQASDVIMLVMNQDGLNGLLLSSLTLGGNASVSAGRLGRGMSSGTDVLLRSAILTYARRKGVFAGADLEGATIRYDQNATVKVYAEKLAAKDLLFSQREGPYHAESLFHNPGQVRSGTAPHCRAGRVNSALNPRRSIFHEAVFPPRSVILGFRRISQACDLS